MLDLAPSSTSRSGAHALADRQARQIMYWRTPNGLKGHVTTLQALARAGRLFEQWARWRRGSGLLGNPRQPILVCVLLGLPFQLPWHGWPR